MKRALFWLLAAALPVLLIGAAPSYASDVASWDGTWNGKLGRTKPWPISLTISQGKVVKFTEDGAPFDVEFSKVTPTHVIFGDRIHYTMKIMKTGETTATGKVHGRHGFGPAVLTKG
jgi:hypothetical protein